MNKRIEIYIETLKEGNSEIIKEGNEETLKGYPAVPLKYFWHKNSPKIEDILFNQEKDNPEYDKARETVLDYYKVSTI